MSIQSRQKFVKIDGDVADVLRSRVACEGNLLRITGPRLDPATYKRVDKALQLLGGKWKSGKTQAHVFDAQASEVIAAALDDGKVLDKKQTFQFFETPAAIADQIVGLADLNGNVGDILEPSAGNGAIIEAIYRHDSLYGFQVDAIDIDPERCAYVRSRLILRHVFEQDFLSFSGRKYGRILMNPPFAGGQDADHVVHAFELLSPGGRLVSVVGEGICTRSDRKSASFQAFVKSHLVEEIKLGNGAFKESGTLSSSRIIVLEKGGQ